MDIFEKDKQYLIQNINMQPLIIKEEKGSTLKDLNGKEDIDGFSGISITNTGHCHPRVINATKFCDTNRILSMDISWCNPIGYAKISDILM